MVYLYALGASLANALTSVLQRMGVENAPKDSTLKLKLLTYALRRKVWLLGFALMIVSFALQATALHVGRLSQVQPVLTTELLFLVLVLAVWFRFNVGLREYLGCIGAGGGLAGFLICADPRGGNLSPPGWEWAVAVGACGAGIALAVFLALQGPPWWRAAMFGTGSAIGFALTAALTKTVSDDFASDWVSIFRHWQTYGLAVFGALSVFLAQNAYHSGPIVASQSTIVLVDPLASILIGVGLFGDNLRTAGAWGPLEVLSLVVMFSSAISLAHSPLVSGIKGTGDLHSELLSRRSRRERTSNPTSPSPATQS